MPTKQPVGNAIIMRTNTAGQKLVEYIMPTFPDITQGFLQEIALDTESYRHLSDERTIPNYIAVRNADGVVLLKYGIMGNNDRPVLTVIQLAAMTDVPLPSEFFKRT